MSLKSDVLEKPVFPVAYALLIFDIASEHGISREDIIAGLNISPKLFDQADARLSLIRISQILYRGMQLTGNPALGYEIGLHSNITTHGFLGYGLLSFPTPREAIEFGRDFLRLRMPNLAIQLIEDGEQAVVDVTETVEQGPIRQCTFDLFMVGIGRIVTQMLNQNPKHTGFVELYFDYPQPDYYEYYREQLPAARFDMGANQMRFPSRYLDMPLVTADPVTAKLVKKQCEQEMAVLGYEVNIVDQVRKALGISSGGYPDLSTLADRLHMSSRTLKRKLQAHGMQFQQILDEVRKRDSVRFLQDPTMKIDDIAVRLGYNDPSNFTRAFRKWMGCSPSAYREQNLKPTQDPE